MNCEKNAVVCEGYNEKTIWKSGKEKADEGRDLTLIIPLGYSILTYSPRQLVGRVRSSQSLLCSQYFKAWRLQKTWSS